MQSQQHHSPGHGGIGFLGALSLIFVIAKLAGAVDWSWWVVFLPVLVPLIVLGVVGMVMLLIFVGGIAVARMHNKKLRTAQLRRTNKLLAVMALALKRD